MNFAELIPFTGAILNLSLAVLVFLRNPREVVNRVYGVLGMCFAIWNFGTFWMFRVHNAEDALFWARFLQFGVIFIPVSFFHLSLLLAKIRVGRYIVLLYILSAFLFFSNFTSFFLKGVRNVGYAWYSVAGPGFWMTGLLFMLLWVSIGLLIRCRRSMPPLHRRRLTPLIVAQLSLTIFGDNDILPILGVDYYPFTHIQIYPFGSMAVILYGMVIGYSVLQHQLLDIQVSLSRLAARTVRLGFLFLVGLCVMLILTMMPRVNFNPYSFFSGLAAVMISGLAASILFPRLFGESTERLEQRILGDRFEYHDQIRSFIASMQWYSDRNLLLSDLNELLVKTVRVRNYEIILLEETTHVFSVFRSFPERPPEQLPELRTDSPIFRFFQTTGAEFLSFNLLYGAPGASEIEREARDSLKHFRAEFCFPFLSDQEPFGLMLLGEKVSEDPYTATDISLMVTLVKSLSLMINQIRLKNQIQHAQELELLGRMSRGMAHDLNNLLTPIWTLIQLVNEGISTDDISDELLPVALRNINTMRAYIRESLFFSENLRPDFQLGRLDMQIAQAVDLTAARRANKQINVVTDSPGEVLVEMDEVLIQRLIANIVANASDASPAHSTIRVELVRLVKTELHRDWLRIRVIDSGEGIKQENLNRIFTPYFTTKDRGDQDRGFGLGLAICRKIVNLHGGNLNVFSQIGKGTTVQIDLPSRQTKPVTSPAMTQ